MLTEPRRPIFTVSPSRSTDVGSPIRIMSGRICCSFSQSMIARRAVGGVALLVAGDQQRQRALARARAAIAPRHRRRLRSSCRWRRGRAARHRRPRAPRTDRRSSRRRAERRRGGRQSRSAASPDPRIATMFSVGPSGGSPRTQRWMSKPSGFSAGSSTSNTSPRAGVTLGQRISSAARATGSIGEGTLMP